MSHQVGKTNFSLEARWKIFMSSIGSRLGDSPSEIWGSSVRSTVGGSEDSLLRHEGDDGWVGAEG